MKALVAGLFCAFSVAAGQSTAECDRGGVLSPSGIGPLRIGMTVDSMAKVCRVVSKRLVAEYELTIHQVRIGADTLSVWERPKGRIELIQITSPIHRTRDSVGVGSSAQSLLDLPDVKGGVGDGTDAYAIYGQTGPLCGLVFWIDGETAEMINRTKGDGLRMLRMRGGGRIVSIDVHGACKG